MHFSLTRRIPLSVYMSVAQSTMTNQSNFDQTETKRSVKLTAGRCSVTEGAVSTRGLKYSTVRLAQEAFKYIV